MRKHDTTYRLQMSPQFTFEDLKKTLNYLDEVGISTVYSAPFFQAREGSTHGYDIIDPFTLNREIGKLEDFKEIGKTLRSKDMTWLQDIVPNHMAYDGGNVWLKDIFELGPQSRYYNFFDINWDYKGMGKVMAPFLGAPLESILEKKELKLQMNETGFSLAYYDNIYPVSLRSYSFILSEVKENNWKEKIESFDGGSEEWQELKVSFLRMTERNDELKKRIEIVVQEINNSRDKIKQLLELQYYLPAHWQITEKEINYRRFFTINDLICLKMEDRQVFKTYHHFIKEMCDAGFIHGLRIDHVDGLFDPEGYLRELRNMMGKDFYIIVEKILEAGEEIHKDWPVEGTSGYDFLAQVNHLFTASKNEAIFSEAYAELSPKVADYEDLVYSKKLFILKERMGGELENLWSLLKDTGLLTAEEQEKETEWKEALSAFLAAFPVYRIYPQDFPLNIEEKTIILKAFKSAGEEAEDYRPQLEQLKQLFLGEAKIDRQKMLYFVQRCQQFSGPLAAKGVEDTSFYIYNRLISHNEVGDSPENFGMTVKEFHEKMLQKKEKFPLSVNATSTHDTKRGEDARMRLNVLSEIPQEWFSKVEEWKEINREVRKNEEVPGINEEYFIYQTLLGGMPFGEEDDFLTRTCDYLQKVLREAKVNSNWAEPNEAYEKGVFNFVEDILNNRKFRKSFDTFQEKVAGLGAVKSLGQVLIKITAPGIPDIYQGTELWDLSYVDPDNRRPVDYNLRDVYISDFKGYYEPNLNAYLKELRENFYSGKIKMFTTYKALQERQSHKDLFQNGEYVALKLTGKYSENFIAYARTSAGNTAVIVVPVVTADIFDPVNLKPTNYLEELTLTLPKDLPKEWINVFTGESIKAEGNWKIGSMFSNFPVALLMNK